MTIEIQEMTPVKILSVYAVFGAAFATLVGASMPGMALGKPAADPAVLQVMADAVLIDAQCRGVTVDMGALMRYGENHGIAAVAIMPLGEQRHDFETAMGNRVDMPPEELCSSIVAQEQTLAPDLLRQP